jgi:hypothetical protein
MSSTSNELQRVLESIKNPSNPIVMVEEEASDEAPLRVIKQNLVKMTAGALLELCDKDPDCSTSKIMRRAIRGMLPNRIVTVTKESVLAITEGKEIVIVQEPEVMGNELALVSRRELVDRTEAVKMERIGVQEVEEAARKRLAVTNPGYAKILESRKAAPVDTSKSSSGPDISKAQRVPSASEARKEAKSANQS